MAAARLLGDVGAYDPKPTDWEIYEGRFAFFLEANKISDAKARRAVLLSTIGEAAYKVVRDLNAPKALNDDAVTYDVLMEQLRAHYGKKRRRWLHVRSLRAFCSSMARASKTSRRHFVSTHRSASSERNLTPVFETS